MPYPISAVHSRRFVAAYADRMRMLFGSALIGYWPLWEASGATANDISPQANNGTYSNVTLAQAGIGDGRTSALFVPASSSYVDIYSAALNADFNGAAGTLAVWIKMSSAEIWTDGAGHNFVDIRVDDNNLVVLYKQATNNTIGWLYYAGIGANNINAAYIIPSPSTTFFHMAMTWDKAADNFVFFYNGTAISGSAGLGTWTGSISSTLCTIGSYGQGIAGIHDGNIAHTILLNRAATNPEIAEMARASV